MSLTLCLSAFSNYTVFGVPQTLKIGYMVPMFFAGTYGQYTEDVVLSSFT